MIDAVHPDRCEAASGSSTWPAARSSGSAPTLEHLTEALQRVRRQRARLREQSESLATGLAAELSASYWREQESGLGRLRRRDPEAELVREVEASPHFDAGWYLRQHQHEILEQRLAPRSTTSATPTSAARSSEGFSTGATCVRHPEAADDGLPALLHAQRNGLVDDGLVDVPAATES